MFNTSSALELHCVFERGRPKLGVELGRFEPSVSQQGAHLFQIVVLFVDFHRHPMPEIVRLQHGMANLAAVCRTGQGGGGEMP